MRNFLYKGVVATTPTSEKIYISPMGVAWKEWTQKFNYNPNDFGKVTPLVTGQVKAKMFDNLDCLTLSFTRAVWNGNKSIQRHGTFLGHF